jgi:putative ABC transport system permease protein
MFTALKHMSARLRAFFRARELDRDFEQELESHLTMLTEDNIRGGMTSEQARRAALIRIGGTASIGEEHRAVRGLPALESVLTDLRFTFRLIAKERWLSAAVIVTLALGIGLNAIGFTIVNAAFLRGLPFKDSDRLYMLAWQTRSGTEHGVSHVELQDWREQSHTFTGIAAFTDTVMNISDDRALPEQERGTRLTANTFSVLGQKLLFGRDFARGDDRKGAEAVVIVSHRIWKNRYGADPGVLGKSVRVNGQPATIIGVMPDGMNFPSNTEFWAPFIPNEAEQRRNNRFLSVFGRLRDGTTRAEAQTELDGIAQRLVVAYPDTNKDFVGARVETFTERYVGGPARIIFLAMMGAVSFVLLIACANVANLLVSRSAHRARELAMRIALGATRWRVVRQLLLETVVLGCIGGSIGLVLAIGGVRLLDAAVQDPDKPYWIVFTADYTVFGYVAAICVLTGVLFGLAPALQLSKTDINQVLKEGGRGSTGSRRARWLSGTLVVGELALTMVLLAGAGLMIRSFTRLYNLDIGISTDHLMTMRMQLPDSKYPNSEARSAFYERLQPQLATIPGIEAVALTTSVPGSNTRERLLEIDGRARASEEQTLYVGMVTISPGFFGVVHAPLLRGRSFHDTDGRPGSETVIINERLASRFFPGEDPIGRRVRFTLREPTANQPAPAWHTIVGISPSIRHGSPRDAELDPIAYLPYRQDPPRAAALLIRSGLPPGSVMDAVRHEVQAIDQDQPVFTIQTLDQMLAHIRWPFRVFGGLFAIFAAIALVLSSVGLYAVIAYSVTQRTQEIGVRMALGADKRQVSWLILQRGLVQLALGLTLGLAGALALSRVLGSVLVQITPGDPVTFAAITMLLAVVSIAACMLPTRRATQVDPLVALRVD